MPENGHHPVGLPLEADELDFSLDLAAERLQVVAKQLLRGALRDVEHERIARVDPIEVKLRESAAALEEGHPVHRGPAIDELLLEREVIEMLHRAGVDDDGLGLVGGSGRSVDDAAGSAMPSKLGGQHETGRAGADDERVQWRLVNG